MTRAWWKAPACVVVLGLAVFGAGCENKTPSNPEGTTAPGTMSADQQKQYADQMKTQGKPAGPGAGGPGGMPFSPGSGGK